MLCPNTGRFLPYSVRNANEAIVKDQKSQFAFAWVAGY
jgi:hypothetical protein